MKFSYIKSIIILCFILLSLSACHMPEVEIDDAERYKNYYSEMQEEDTDLNNTNDEIINKDIDEIIDDDKSVEIEDEDIYLDNGGINKMVVAFFSASGNTKKVSKKIIEYYHKKGIVVDLYEIEPKIPYNEKDLDYMDKESRCCVEHFGNLRPELKDEDFKIDKHEDIFIGYPVWWGEAPNIIYTFLEKYKFTGKNIHPFVTSHTSPLGNSTEVLKKYTDANVLEGKRFVLDDQDNEVDSWLDSLKLEK